MHSHLIAAAEGLRNGGETDTFTPMLFFKARKPEASASAAPSRKSTAASSAAPASASKAGARGRSKSRSRA